MAVNTGAIPYQAVPGGPFLKGNPGKPKGVRHMTTKIMEAIAAVSEGSRETQDVEIVRTLVKKAKEGDMQAIKLIFNYVDGMPVQGIELSNKDGERFQFSLMDAEEARAALQSLLKK